MKNKPCRVVFMGTPSFSVSTLEKLINNDAFEVVGVVTQPDKKQGRGKKIVFSPVKELALASEIKVIQPVSLRNETVIQELQEMMPDVIVVIAYGQILPQTILELPKMGCINVHASLLPKYRGAAPMQYALMASDEKTGITIMYMDQGMDTGDIIKTTELMIDKEENFASLHDKMKEAGAKLLEETLLQMIEGKAQRIKQDETLATYAAKLSKEDEKINWHKSIQEIDALVRALDPVPGAYSMFRGKRVKFCKTKVTIKSIKHEIGKIVYLSNESIVVAAKGGEIEVLELQMENSRRMRACDFINGNRVMLGEIFS